MAFWQPKIGPKSSQNHKKSSWHLKNVTVPHFLSARRFQKPTKRFREASKKLQSTSDRRPEALQKPQNDLLKPPKAPFPVNKSGPEAVNTLQMIAKTLLQKWQWTCLKPCRKRKVTFRWWWPLYASQAVVNDNRRGQSKKSSLQFTVRSSPFQHAGETKPKRRYLVFIVALSYFNRAIQLHTGHNWKLKKQMHTGNNFGPSN